MKVDVRVKDQMKLMNENRKTGYLSGAVPAGGIIREVESEFITSQDIKGWAPPQLDYKTPEGRKTWLQDMQNRKEQGV